MPNILKRRNFILGAASLAAGCARAIHEHQPQAHFVPVSIVRAASYSHDLVDPIRRILIEHHVPIAGKNILLKPNLVEFSAQAPINTNPVFVAAAYEAFHSLGAKTVTIGEGPGHRRMTLDMAEAAGFFAAVPRFEDNFVDLNTDEVRRVELIQPFSSLRELFLPHSVLACDLLVSLPKMKTHHWTGATLSMKNLFGVVPGSVYGWPKNILHWAGIDECVADLHYLFPHQFSIVDGIEGMEGNGPILGSPKRAGVIVAGAHAPSVDATCARVMQIDPAKIRYLNLVAGRSNWNPGITRQLGESVGSVSTPFALHPDLNHFRLEA